MKDVHASEKAIKMPKGSSLQGDRGVSILGVGVATMDIYAKQKRMYPGGNEVNVVCHAKNCGARAGFLGVFADDSAGALMEETIKLTGVDCSLSHHEKGSSGFSIVELKEDGDRVFLYWNKQGVTDLHPIQFDKKEMEYVSTFDVCCMGRCASVSVDKIKALAKRGVAICYDFHAVFPDEVIEEIAPSVTYAFFSCSHLDKNETMEVLKKAVSLGSRLAIGTRGSETIYAYDGVKFYEQEPFKVKAVDALGAGDSFIAAFLTSYILSQKTINPSDEDESVQRALEYAAKYAAKVVLIDGSIGIHFDIEPDKISEVINIDADELKGITA